MDNSKRNVHNSGPLGMLVKNGQVKKIDDSEPRQPGFDVPTKTGGSYFKTQSGLEFTEHELVYVDPKECEPWKYANRQADELGDIAALVESIKANKQLQPALIRKHPHPHDGIKYEIIFGRRRHIACLKLGIPFLAIHKEITNVQDAIASQDAENKFRNDVSNYSNAKLYQKLLNDGVFRTEKELSQKLRLSTSSLNDLMAYAKIPEIIVTRIPNIHALSKNIALKIVQLLNKSDVYSEKIHAVAHELGKSITSPVKLENAIERMSGKNQNNSSTKMYKARSGKKLFTYMVDYRGAPCLVVNKEILALINIEEMCKTLSKHLEEKIIQSGAPD